MTRFAPTLLALLVLTSCTSTANQEQTRGPQAAGVSPDSPKDAIGIMLGWTPDQTITNFRTSAIGRSKR
jgi:hypothetical protein